MVLYTVSKSTDMVNSLVIKLTSNVLFMALRVQVMSVLR